MRVSMTVNGEQVSREIEARTLLVDFLRDACGLSGTKIGCDTSSCGACTVLLDGKSVKSCTVLAAQVEGEAVTTIEGLAQGRIQEAFRNQHALQCGYCTPGMVMAAASLIAHGQATDERSVRDGLKGNLCRCTGYQNIVAAVLEAAK